MSNINQHYFCFATYVFENCTEGDNFLCKVFMPFKSASEKFGLEVGPPFN